MPATPGEGDLTRAIRAVSAACTVTRLVQADLDSIAQLTKDDRSPVTVADFAAQAVIAHQLVETDRSLRLVAEESSDALRSEGSDLIVNAIVDVVRKVWSEADAETVLNAIDVGNHDASAERYWTLDPIDGTKGFIRGNQYAVSLALIENGRVVLGVMGCPNLSADQTRGFDQADATGLIFHAVRGGGTWCIPACDTAGTPQPVKARSTATGPIQVCESVESSHSKQDDTARIVAHLGGAGTPARLDSQCKYAVVARGQADAYLRLPTRKSYVEKIWDHAAGQIVAEEAGAVVSDIAGRALDFSHGAALAQNRGVICASPAYHARIIDAIRQLGIGAGA